MNTVGIDKPFIAFLVNMIVSVLIMKGYITPDHADQLTQELQTVIGGFLALVGIVALFSHHTEVKKAEIASKTSPTTPASPTPPTQQTTVVVPPSAGTTP